MEKFKKIQPEEWQSNPFVKIGKEWMLLTATGKQESNPMTASWGGVGILWGRPVAFLFVRPQRYTHTLAEEGEYFTACFFSPEYHSVLQYCGAHSGKNEDKIKQCNLTPIKHASGAVYYGEAESVFVLKKCYKEPLKEGGFIEKELLSNYKNGDFHTVYVCEIVELLQKDK